MLKLEEDLSNTLVGIISSFKIKDITVELETPRESFYGDLATNIALKLSKYLKKNPSEIAQLIVEKIEPLYQDVFEGIEIVAPGFINFRLSWNFLRSYVIEIIKDEDNFAKNNLGKGKKILIEFVSANPTGPLSIAHGRQAAIGLSLTRILKFSGYRVEKEYFINDEGTQVELLGQSLKARCLELLGEKIEFPEHGYQGEYIIQLAKELIEEKSLDLKKIKTEDENFFIDYAIKKLLSRIKSELSNFGVDYEYWISQRDLESRGKIKEALDCLRKLGFLYEKDGACWFHSTDFGDDQDRVVKRKDGRYTYFAADIAYHKEKVERGYDLMLDIWGPDHLGYMPRLKAAFQALGFDSKRLIILIVQLATIYKAGKPILLSTRKGNILTLREVVTEIGKDATLYFLLTRKLDSHLDFDLDLAKKESLENPVYYIQYAYARICSILNFAKDKNYSLDSPPSLEILKNLDSEEEKLILRSLAQFSRVVKISALSFEPSNIATYLQELASRFHSFYNKHRVVSDNTSSTQARLYLCKALGITIRQGLFLLGISTPEKM